MGEGGATGALTLRLNDGFLMQRWKKLHAPLESCLWLREQLQVKEKQTPVCAAGERWLAQRGEPITWLPPGKARADRAYSSASPYFLLRMLMALRERGEQ